MSTELERKNLVVREMPTATYAAMSGVFTGHRLRVALTCEQPVGQSTRVEIVEESDDLGDTAARYCEQLRQRPDALSKWLAELCNDARLRSSDDAGKLLARAKRNAGFSHATIGLGRSAFCAVGPSANRFLNSVLERLMMDEE
jgi:hypothetical protein